MARWGGSRTARLEKLRRGENENISCVSGGGRSHCHGSVGVVQAQKEAEKKSVLYTSAEKATFKQSPMGGVSMATIWAIRTRGLTNVHEVRGRIRRGNAHTYERRVDRRYQRRLPL